MNIERRYIHGSLTRMQAGEEHEFEGLASRVNKPYVMYENEDEVWTEEIAKEAFDGLENQDVRVLIDHDPTLILGRTKAGTAKVWVDEDGLRYSWKNPDTTHGQNIAISISRGDVDQSSFGFSTQWKDSDWEEFTREDGKREYKRIIRKIRALYDVSPVTFPASPETYVQNNDYKAALDAYKRAKDAIESNTDPETQNNENTIIEAITLLNERLAEC